jgi:hypothetical protein
VEAFGCGALGADVLGELFFAVKFLEEQIFGGRIALWRARLREAAAAPAAGVPMKRIDEMQLAGVGDKMVHGAKGGRGDVRDIHLRG